MAELKKIDGQSRPIRQILSKEKYKIDVYQREFKWQTEHISTLIDDLESKFITAFDRKHDRAEVANYPPYFLGSFVINSKGEIRFIVDGQQRLTTLTLLLIYLRNYAESRSIEITNVNDLIYSEQYGKKSFNIDIPDRNEVMTAIFNNELDENSEGLLESQKNLILRFKDIEDSFPDELKDEKVLPYFVDWLLQKVVMVEIIAYNDDDAYTTFETMNDRGLNLNSTDMLKGYLVANINNEEERNKINDLWKRQVTRLIEFEQKEQITFFKNWLRAKYAEGIREGKKGASNKDFEKIDKYHRWVRDEKEKLNLKEKEDYIRFSNDEFKYFSNIYLKVLNAIDVFNDDLRNIYYNDYHPFAFQEMILLSAIKYEDSEEIVKKKLQLVSYFIEMYIVLRRINNRSLGYSAIKYTMFTSIIKQIRDKDLEEMKDILKAFIEDMSEHWEGFDDYMLKSQNKGFVKFLLARITQFVEEQVGINSSVKNYMDTGQRKPFEIEHLLPNRYQDYKVVFGDEKEFDTYRNKMGALILLPRGFNQSFNADTYKEKIKHYYGQNILARSLNPLCYSKSPSFMTYIQKENLSFKDVANMDKNAIDERTNLYKEICKKIWNLERFDEIIADT